MRQPEPLTLQAIIDALPSFGSRHAVGLREDYGLRWWSYERLHHATRHAAALLRDAGIGKGDHVVIRGQSSPEWVAFLFGAVLRGAVVVPIDHDSPPELIRRIAGIVDAKLFITSGEPGEPVDCCPLLELNALYAEAAPHVDDVVTPVTPSDPVVVFFTSGTTSEPRGVLLTHGNVLAQIARFRRWRLLARHVGSRILVMAPVSHAQGFILGIAIPLSLGLSVIYTHSTHPGHLIRLLRDNRVVLFSTVPRVLHMLSSVFQSQRYGKGPLTLGDRLRTSRLWILRRHYTFTHMRRVVGYSALWVVLVGGAPLPPADEDFWRVSGCLLVQGYGLTETTAIVSVNYPLVGAFGSVGRPLGDQEVRLADDGEILVRGGTVMPRYFSHESQGAVEDGFLRTGDVGRFDARRRLFIVGRKKDVIVTGEGFNVHGTDVEMVLNALPGVEDSVVLGLERDGHTEVHSVLLLRRGGDAAKLVSRANRDLLAHQRIKSWTVWPERDFPRSALLKPRRNEIAARVSSSDTRTGSEPPRSLEEVLAIEDRQQRVAAIATYIGQTGGDDRGARRLSLVRDLGLGSLDMIELLTMVEKQSGRSLDRVSLEESITIAGLQELLSDAAGGEKTMSPLDASDAPRWAELPILQTLRRVMNPAVLDTLVRLRTRLEVSGTENLAGIELPAVFAGGGHEHGFDVLLVYSALPGHLRKRLAVVAGRWVFTYAFGPAPETTLAQRALVRLGFHLLVPLFFPFVLSSQFTRSRDTLLESCRLIDRGYSLIAFHGRGMGIVARQCGVPIVPVRIGNRERAGFLPHRRRAEASIHFERPIVPNPTTSDADLARCFDDLFEQR